MDIISVGIVDDHKIVVDGFERIINNSGIAKVICKAHSATECWKMLQDNIPKILLLDVGLPDESGMDLCPKIHKTYPDIGIIMLTNYSEYAIISHVLHNGASGYILKNASTEEVLDGIIHVAQGEKNYTCHDTNTILNSSDDQKIDLTLREREVLKFIIQGFTSEEIAVKMCLSFETIRFYRKNLYIKLDVHSTAELINIATKRRLI